MGVVKSMKLLIIILTLCSTTVYAKGGGHASGHSSHMAFAAHPAVISTLSMTEKDEAKHKAKNGTGIALAIGGATGLFIIYSMFAELFDERR